MTTVQQFMVIKLAATFSLTFDEADKIVAEEVKSWRRAGIPLNWQEDVSKASSRVKHQKGYSAVEKYNAGGCLSLLHRHISTR